MIFNPWPAFARPGAIQTRDGKRHQGHISLTNGAVQISNTVEVTVIAKEEIARLSFDPEAIAAVPDTKGEGMGLLGYYFANINVHGPVQVRLDPSIDFDWATAEPIEGLGKDYFAIIWMGYLEAPASGEFTFSLSADDRARLQIGQELVIESSRREQQSESSGKLKLEQGQRYPVTLLYQDLVGPAKIRLTWSGPEIPKTAIPAEQLYPASFVSEHTADIQCPRGLLATSYTATNFSGTTATHVATSIDITSATNTRWTGQLRAEHSEPYTFYVATEGPVRLRLNGKLLLDKWNQEGMAELKANIRLTAGDLYDLQLETMGAGTRRLLWSSPSQPKTVIGQSHLLPFKSQHLSPTGPNHLLPAGLLLRYGSFVAGRVESFEDDFFQCSGLLDSQRIPAHEVARVVCQPLPQTLAERVSSARPGILLANGDFVEGTFVGLEGSRVTLNSVLFGLRTYASPQVLAVVLRETQSKEARYEIELRDQSVLFGADFEVQPGRIVLKDTVVAGLAVPEEEIHAIKRR